MIPTNIKCTKGNRTDSASKPDVLNPSNYRYHPYKPQTNEPIVYWCSGIQHIENTSSDGMRGFSNGHTNFNHIHYFYATKSDWLEAGGYNFWE